MKIVCNITKKAGCTDCTECGNMNGNRYGSCFNCRFRHPLMPASAGTSERCRRCSHPPQREYVGMHFNTAIGWCCDGGIEINAISNAVFEMHRTPHNHVDRLNAYKRLKDAIAMVEKLPFIGI